MKKIVLTLIVIGLVCIGLIGYLIFSPNEKKTPLSIPVAENKKIVPSETLIDYSDPAGFAFSYPDNLSITKNDTEDTKNSYADLQLFSKDVSGSLSLKITDSKFKTIDEWLKLNKGTSNEEPKDVNLGTLKAKEIKTADRIFVGVLDQGILFNVEIPRIEEAFWSKVYEKLLSSFSFVAPEAASSNTNSSEDVSFEGEEVVE